MPWISFLLALGCFAIAARTQSIGLALICLLLALGLLLFGALSLVSARIHSRTQGPMAMNPALEKHRLQGAAGGTAAAAKQDPVEPSESPNENTGPADQPTTANGEQRAAD